MREACSNQLKHSYCHISQDDDTTYVSKCAKTESHHTERCASRILIAQVSSAVLAQKCLGPTILTIIPKSVGSEALEEIQSLKGFAGRPHQDGWASQVSFRDIHLGPATIQSIQSSAAIKSFSRIPWKGFTRNMQQAIGVKISTKVGIEALEHPHYIPSSKKKHEEKSERYAHEPIGWRLFGRLCDLTSTSGPTWTKRWNPRKRVSLADASNSADMGSEECQRCTDIRLWDARIALWDER